MCDFDKKGEKADVREMMEPNIVISSYCYHETCGSSFFVKNCWCCEAPHDGRCYDDKPSCDAVCPRPHPPPK